MINHVPNYNTCKRLNEAGFKMRTQYIINDKNAILRRDYTAMLVNSGQHYSAPMATEILEKLPDVNIFSSDGNDFRVEHGLDEFESESLSNALAECFIYLKENKLI